MGLAGVHRKGGEVRTLPKLVPQTAVRYVAASGPVRKNKFPDAIHQADFLDNPDPLVGSAASGRNGTREAPRTPGSFQCWRVHGQVLRVHPWKFIGTKTADQPIGYCKGTRSATEAFLYRRLETLTDTAGKFHLNAELPIPFDGWGRMEVDLLCERSRVAIELDGGQHLGDPDAYRRDRRKDALLQENGYLVLRFLAEDVGKYLDQVLDAILRALSHQGTRI